MASSGQGDVRDGIGRRRAMRRIGVPVVALDRDPRRSLRFGPVQRLDGIDIPDDAIAMAERRVRPLAARMHGDCTIGEVKK